METQKRFDLNQAVETWRQSLASRPGPSSADIEEMESHLREEHAALRQTGLSEEEAFVIALKRLGPSVEVAAEFTRAEPGQIWRERLFWVAAALLVLQFMNDLKLVLMEKLGPIVNSGKLYFPNLLFSYPGFLLECLFPLAPVLLFMWYVTRPSRSKSINLSRIFPSRLRLMEIGLLAIALIELPIWYLDLMLPGRGHALNLPLFYIFGGSDAFKLINDLFGYLAMPALLLALMAWMLPMRMPRVARHQ